MTSRTNETAAAVDDLLFTIEELRTPAAYQSKQLKSKIAHLKKLHNKIDDDFLDNRIAPRLLVIIAEKVSDE